MSSSSCHSPGWPLLPFPLVVPEACSDQDSKWADHRSRNRSSAERKHNGVSGGNREEGTWTSDSWDGRECDKPCGAMCGTHLSCVVSYANRIRLHAVGRGTVNGRVRGREDNHRRGLVPQVGHPTQHMPPCADHCAPSAFCILVRARSVDHRGSVGARGCGCRARASCSGDVVACVGASRSRLRARPHGPRRVSAASCKGDFQMRRGFH